MYVLQCTQETLMPKAHSLAANMNCARSGYLRRLPRRYISASQAPPCSQGRSFSASRCTGGSGFYMPLYSFCILRSNFLVGGGCRCAPKMTKADVRRTVHTGHSISACQPCDTLPCPQAHTEDNVACERTGVNPAICPYGTATRYTPTTHLGENASLLNKW